MFHDSHGGLSLAAARDIGCGHADRGRLYRIQRNTSRRLGGHTASAVPGTASASITPTISTGPSATPGRATDAPCAFKLIKTDLPVWARQGFHGPPYNAFPFVTTNRGDVVGVLFGYPLQAPPVNAANKILWVPNDLSAGELTIDAHLVGRSETVDIDGISSFGPSYDDVPKPGCWRFTLHWKGQAETVDIVYGAR
jgi:hypothetical protein